MTDDVPGLLIQDESLPVDEALAEAKRLIKGAALINTYLTSTDQNIRDEVTAYLAECILAERPVTVPFALNALGHWEAFKSNFFRVLALEEETLNESVGEGVPLQEGDIEILREVTRVYRESLLAA